MDIRKSSAFSIISFYLFVIQQPSPSLAWFKSNRGNERDVMFKSSYKDDSMHSDEFHKDSGLKSDEKDGGGRGFFYFEKGGKKLVGYMDYGDDKKKEPWQTEKDNVMTY